MVYCSLKNDTYYESQSDVLEYLIKNEDGAIIYCGRSIKSPKTHTNRINVTEKIRNYLNSNLGPGWESGSTQIVRQQENAIGVFALTDGELLLEKYAFIYSFDNVFNLGEDKIISNPINGKLDPRMKYLISAFGKLEVFDMRFSGDTNLKWEQSSTTIYFTANKEPVAIDSSDWISNVVITSENSGGTYTGHFTFDYGENGASIRDGFIDFSFVGSIYGATQRLELTQGTAPEYFTMEVLTDGEIEISTLSSTNGDIYYKKNTVNWTPISAGTIQVEEGDIVKWKRNVNSGNYFGKQIVLNCEVNVFGDILSLEYGDDFAENDTANIIFRKYTGYNLFAKGIGGDIKSVSGVTMPAIINQDEAFEGLFAGFGLTDANSLSLPATSLTKYCYAGMFRDCSAITAAPYLPATVLVEGCYQGMFSGCISFSTVPQLPATTLAKECYAGMFAGTSLTTAPELPVETLAIGCYARMFSGCTSLVNAPELHSTTLSQECYKSMFAGCTSLVNAPELPATVLPQIVEQSGEWDIWDKGCYTNMFGGCTSLVTAPALPATSVTTDCYESMFAGCNSLVNPPALPATDLSGATICYAYMFAGCTSLVNAPALPATVLSEGCYEYMFEGCTSMTTAPYLLANVPEYYCYQYMFSGCTSLNYIKCLLKRSNLSYTEGWLDGVSYSGTFVKKTGVSWRNLSSADGIPSSWTVQEADS